MWIVIELDKLIDAKSLTSVKESMKKRGAEDVFDLFLSAYENIKERYNNTELEKIARKTSMSIINDPKDDLSTFLSAYLSLPNLSHPDVPHGLSEDDNILIKESTFEAPDRHKTYQEIGFKFNIFHPEIYPHITGEGFPLLFSVGPHLERALVELMLDHHISCGYEDVSVPTVVHERTLNVAGSFPERQQDCYRIEKTDLYLNPTIEMQQTSFIAEKHFHYDDLPIKAVGYVRSFRMERGKAVDLYTTLHEFGKVECFTVTTEDGWKDMLESLFEVLENLLDKLGLQWRKILLCTGDMGQAATLTYDYEVYCPGSKKWLEVSSLGYRDTYQAVRLNATYQDGSERKYVHIFSAPAFAIPRILCAVLETSYQEDGTLKLPDALVGRAGLPESVTQQDFKSKLLQQLRRS